jgi:hypothetical protein
LFVRHLPALHDTTHDSQELTMDRTFDQTSAAACLSLAVVRLANHPEKREVSRRYLSGSPKIEALPA